MKLVTAVSVCALLSVGAANAAIATYDFENANVNSVGVPSFGGALTPLGVTSSTITGAPSAPTGVQFNLLDNNGAPPNHSNTTINFGLKSFAIGGGGTWTLLFADNGTTAGVSSLSFVYDETEPTGFQASIYDQLGNLLSTQIIDPVGLAHDQCEFASTCSSVSFSGFGTIGKLIISDRGTDNAFIDNLSVDTVASVSGVPEPSTYFMIGSALAALAAYRRRRV